MGAAELRRFAQGEVDRRAALRALATAQALEGASRADAARVVGRERQSLHGAVLRCVEPRGSPDSAEGLAGLHAPRSGRPEKLAAAPREELLAWVLAGTAPEVDGLSSDRLLDIAARIQERWTVSYTLPALSRMLRRMDLPWRTTRPVHPKADAAAQGACEKTPSPRSAGSRPPIPDRRCNFGARTRPEKARRAAPAAGPPAAPRKSPGDFAASAGAPRQRFLSPCISAPVPGALRRDLACGRARRAHAGPGGPAQMPAAFRWHGQAALQVAGKVPLPPHSPELDPAERAWSYLRERCLSSRLYRSERANHRGCALRRLDRVT